MIGAQPAQTAPRAHGKGHPARVGIAVFIPTKEDEVVVFLAGTQLFFSLSMRSLHKPLLQLGLFSNLYLLGAIAIGFILQLGVISIPLFANAFKVQNLPAHDWGLVLALSVVPLVLNEISKLFMREPE